MKQFEDIKLTHSVVTAGHQMFAQLSSPATCLGISPTQVSQWLERAKRRMTDKLIAMYEAFEEVDLQRCSVGGSDKDVEALMPHALADELTKLRRKAEGAVKMVKALHATQGELYLEASLQDAFSEATDHCVDVSWAMWSAGNVRSLNVLLADAIVKEESPEAKDTKVMSAKLDVTSFAELLSPDLDLNLRQKYTGQRFGIWEITTQAPETSSQTILENQESVILKILQVVLKPEATPVNFQLAKQVLWALKEVKTIHSKPLSQELDHARVLFDPDSHSEEVLKKAQTALVRNEAAKLWRAFNIFNMCLDQAGFVSMHSALRESEITDLLNVLMILSSMH